MGDSTMYKGELMKHFKDPHNMKELKDFDAEATYRNPVCGDSIKIQLKIDNGVIEDVGFEGMGCAVSIAYASKVTDYVKGMKVEEVREMDAGFIKELFGQEVKPEKRHCGHIAFNAVKKAVSEYKN